MKKRIFLLALFIAVVFSACTLNQEIDYYSDTNNYITATGTVTHIKYNENQDALYLGFDSLSPGFSDNTFKIVGKNLLIAQDNGIDQKLQMGKQIEFISTPKYFGDGYVMPIVEIVVDGEVLLSFEQGQQNWLEWLGDSLS